MRQHAFLVYCKSMITLHHCSVTSFIGYPFVKELNSKLQLWYTNHWITWLMNACWTCYTLLLTIRRYAGIAVQQMESWFKNIGEQWTMGKEVFTTRHHVYGKIYLQKSDNNAHWLLLNRLSKRFYLRKPMDWTDLTMPQLTFLYFHYFVFIVLHDA